MASCVRNTRTKNYQNPIIAFKVTVENVRGPSFFETQCTSLNSLRQSPNMYSVGISLQEVE